MKDLSYFQMRAHLYPREKQFTADVKFTELTDLWFCSEKNVKRKIKQYVQDGKLVYLPGNGRGRASIITFLKPFQAEVETEVTRLIKGNDLESLIKMMQLPIPKTWVSNVSKEIQNLFGYYSDSESSDVLKTYIKRRFTTLDPAHASANVEMFLIHQIADSLLVFDQESDLVKPQLAHHWETPDGGKTWIFHLRKGVRFHNGDLLTSEDVKYTFKRIRSSSSQHDWLVRDIEEIDCLSPYKIRISLKKPNRFFLRYVCSQNMAILPRNVPFAEEKWIGTGAYELVKKSADLVVLKANDNYFLSRPFIDEIQIYYFPFSANQPLRYDLLNKEEDAPTTVKSITEVGFRCLVFNFRKDSIVHNPFFREAMFNLLDMKKLWSELGRKNLLEASSYFYWNSKSPVKNFADVPTLLEKANYHGDVLTLYVLGQPSFVEDAEWIQKEAKKVNLHFQIRTFNLGELYESELNQADLLLMGEVASTDHHLSFIGAFLNKTLVFNRFLSPTHLNKLQGFFDQMQQEESKDRREKWINLAENYIKTENLFIYLYHPVKQRTFHSMIHNIQVDSFGLIDYKKLWING
ncbi:ABC transporter substrate-binding protein [Bacillus sp. FJAT-29814]|uniref:ABC transporter substrate-binding protein n=1 Tax=Bacillus sp. FJAT-29814 TaxID=1729688 RepID=UPI000831B4CF|nr:ABC transporter substrate-binding protein [Bacillus sp. FJAT-29814]